MHTICECKANVVREKSFLKINAMGRQHSLRYVLLYLTRIPTHTVTSSFLIGTPNCIPWRKVVPVSGLLYLYALFTSFKDHRRTIFCATIFLI